MPADRDDVVRNEPDAAVTRPDLPRGVRLGVDVGSVRVGLAASDPDAVLAVPVATVRRDRTLGPGSSDVAAIVTEVCERGAAVVYVGLPLSLSGAEGASAASARAYAGVLARAVAPVPVHLVDERMSTVSAHQALGQAGRSSRRRREVVDQAAAVVILQAAMDAERSTGRWAGDVVEALDGAGTEGSEA